MNQSRPSWDDTANEILTVLEKRSTCYKLHVAGILFDPITKDLICGYNGAPTGMPHCDVSDLVLDGNHHINCLHVEDNLAARAGEKAQGRILYLSCNPCRRCTLKIVQMGVKEVVFRDIYNMAGDLFYAAKTLNNVGIGFRQYT